MRGEIGTKTDLNVTPQTLLLMQLGFSFSKYCIAASSSACVALSQEMGNIIFCPSNEKFNTVVLKGISKISDTP